MNAIVVEGNISPRISFIVSLLDEAVKCGPKHSKYILQMLPHNMVIEQSRGKTNNVVSEQVPHKPGCTSTEDG